MNIALMRQIPKTELSPETAVSSTLKWKLGPLSYHASAARESAQSRPRNRLGCRRLVIYDHIGFRGAYARTNLSFHYVGDYWNDRISCIVVVSGIWRFYRDEHYKGAHWDLGPGYYESFFARRPG